MPQERLIAGAMSGTSADGIDVAIVRIVGSGHDMSAALLTHHHRAYAPQLRRAICAIRGSGQGQLSELAELGRLISLVYAAAVNEALVAGGLRADDLTAVAAHGQTLYHAPPDTIQWLDPALLAAEVGAPVISDFRRADCAAGGQGAPLVPLADYLLFRHPTRSRVLVNIGGIANLTYLPPVPAGSASADPPRLIAFDTGPGNCICDHLCREFDPDGPGYDLDGRLASAGSIIKELAEHVLSHAYFRQPPPKSTDGPQMIGIYESAPPGLRPYAPRCRNEAELNLRNELATACWITARSLAGAINGQLPGVPDEVILSGGGSLNRAMVGHLRALLGGTALLRTDELGVPGAAKEAMAFALLGAATLDGAPGNLPSVTGARRPVVLGSITPRP